MPLISFTFHEQWVLGNHSQSFLRMLGVEMSSESNSSILSSLQAPFLDPSISQYCMMLATKTVMKNAIGEYRAAVLSQWAVLMNATSLSRCGLPVSESFRCFLNYNLLIKHFMFHLMAQICWQFLKLNLGYFIYV